MCLYRGNWLDAVVSILGEYWWYSEIFGIVSGQLKRLHLFDCTFVRSYTIWKFARGFFIKRRWLKYMYISIWNLIYISIWNSICVSSRVSGIWFTLRIWKFNLGEKTAKKSIVDNDNCILYEDRIKHLLRGQFSTVSDISFQIFLKLFDTKNCWILENRS